jgi:hypothetical protein
MIMEEARLYSAVTEERGVHPLFQITGRLKLVVMGAYSPSLQRKSVIRVFGT